MICITLDGIEAGCLVFWRFLRIEEVLLPLALTKYEAAEYSNIGVNKIEAMLREPNCHFVLHVGQNKKLVKHKEIEELIGASFVIWT